MVYYVCKRKIKKGVIKMDINDEIRKALDEENKLQKRYEETPQEIMDAIIEIKLTVKNIEEKLLFLYPFLNCNTST